LGVIDLKIKVLFLIELGILGIYVIPKAVTRYSGSHTWDINGSTGVASINLVKCHEYIGAELNATTNTKKC
jgi:hypothetical protein